MIISMTAMDRGNRHESPSFPPLTMCEHQEPLISMLYRLDISVVTTTMRSNQTANIHQIWTLITWLLALQDCFKLQQTVITSLHQTKSTVTAPFRAKTMKYPVSIHRTLQTRDQSTLSIFPPSASPALKPALGASGATLERGRPGCRLRSDSTSAVRAPHSSVSFRHACKKSSRLCGTTSSVSLRASGSS